MKYERFEDVPVWQDGIKLTTKVFEITGDKAFRFKGDIANQLQRAALSVPNNISEGFERGTTPELITFLYYAKGSAGEVRSILHVINRLPFFIHLKSEISNLLSLAESISRQLRAWAEALQNSDIKGQRHLTQRSRETYQDKKRADALMEEIRKSNEDNLGRILEERRKKREAEQGTQPPGTSAE
jgi:four helix bundle protein